MQQHGGSLWGQRSQGEDGSDRSEGQQGGYEHGRRRLAEGHNDPSSLAPSADSRRALLGGTSSLWGSPAWTLAALESLGGRTLGNAAWPL